MTHSRGGHASGGVHTVICELNVFRRAECFLPRRPEIMRPCLLSTCAGMLRRPHQFGFARFGYLRDGSIGW